MTYYKLRDISWKKSLDSKDKIRSLRTTRHKDKITYKITNTIKPHWTPQEKHTNLFFKLQKYI